MLTTITDILLPYFKGRRVQKAALKYLRKLRKSGAEEGGEEKAYNQLINNATSVRNELDTKYKKTEQDSLDLTIRNLSEIKKDIAPSENDHDKYNKAKAYDRLVTEDLEGITPEERAARINIIDTDGMIYTLKDNHGERPLGLLQIRKEKDPFVIEANRMILEWEIRVQRIHRRFNCRLSTFLTGLNKNSVFPELRLELTAEPQLLPLWDCEEVYSSPADLKNTRRKKNES